MPEQTQTLDKVQEDQVLSFGYSTMHQRTWPFIHDPNETLSPDLANFLSLELQNLEVPPHLQLSALEKDINPICLPQIQHLWEIIQKNSFDFLATTIDLYNHWRLAPLEIPDEELADPFSQNLVKNPPLRIMKEFKRGILCTINPRKKPINRELARMEIGPTSTLNKLDKWKTDNKALRELFYKQHKEYIVALRVYGELLLERSADKTQSALPLNHPARNEIAIWNRHLRLIDVLYQGAATAKTKHHEQSKRRIRKTGLIPYFYHEFEVTLATITDVICHIIEEPHLPSDFNIAVLTTICSIHDLLEDTNLSIETVRETLKKLFNAYDSSLDHVTQGGFGLPREELIKRYLDLISEDDLETIRNTLRILSNNTQLSEKETEKAAKQNIAGKTQTFKLLEIPKDDEQARQIKSWNIEDKKSKTFETFEEEYDDNKLTEFLIRLNAITSSAAIRQYALIVKNEDRVHNLSTQRKMPVAKQLATLRATTTRLIAWEMLDYDHKKPLYNSLQRLIKTTLKTYEEFIRDHAEETDERDTNYIAQLKEWEAELTVRGLCYEVPERIKKVISNWEAANQDTQTEHPPEEQAIA